MSFGLARIGCWRHARERDQFRSPWTTSTDTYRTTAASPSQITVLDTAFDLYQNR